MIGLEATGYIECEALNGRERAESIAEHTEYEWHDDAGRDPFHRLLNKGTESRVLEQLSLASDGVPASIAEKQ